MHMANRHMKKMPDITNHQDNAIHSHSEYHLTPVRMAIMKRLKEDVEKEPFFTAGRKVNCTATVENSIAVSQKIKNGTTV
jgi:L-asparaginase II